MKSTPVLMQPWGIRATLAGLKTQTRRARGLELINQNPDDWQLVALFMDGQARFYNRVTKQDVTIKCPYGGDWDELWFKETYAVDKLWDNTKPSLIEKGVALFYPATADLMNIPDWVGKFRSSMFMCRWMSRIQRPIIGLRCERLQSITEADAIAEGVEYHPLAKDYYYHFLPKSLYFDIWDEINGKTLPVSVNPYVWIPEWENKK